MNDRLNTYRDKRRTTEPLDGVAPDGDDDDARGSDRPIEGGG